MIRSFKHKGLERFFLTGSKAGIQPSHASRLEKQLTRLQNALNEKDLEVPGYYLHPLKGQLDGYWSVRVSGNWRLTFRFVNGDVEVLDYMDYH